MKYQEVLGMIKRADLPEWTGWKYIKRPGFVWTTTKLDHPYDFLDIDDVIKYSQPVWTDGKPPRWQDKTYTSNYPTLPAYRVLHNDTLRVGGKATIPARYPYPSRYLADRLSLIPKAGLKERVFGIKDVNRHAQYNKTLKNFSRSLEHARWNSLDIDAFPWNFFYGKSLPAKQYLNQLNKPIPGYKDIDKFNGR